MIKLQKFSLRVKSLLFIIRIVVVGIGKGPSDVEELGAGRSAIVLTVPDGVWIIAVVHGVVQGPELILIKCHIGRR